MFFLYVHCNTVYCLHVYGGRLCVYIVTLFTVYVFTWKQIWAFFFAYLCMCFHVSRISPSQAKNSENFCPDA